MTTLELARLQDTLRRYLYEKRKSELFRGIRGSQFEKCVEYVIAELTIDYTIEFRKKQEKK